MCIHNNSDVKRRHKFYGKSLKRVMGAKGIKTNF